MTKRRLHPFGSDETNVAAVLCDVHGVVLAAELCDLFEAGVSPEGREFGALFELGCVDQASQLLMELRSGKSVSARELRIPSQDGHAQTMYASGFPQEEKLVILLSPRPAPVFDLLAGFIRNRKTADVDGASRTGLPSRPKLPDEEIFEEFSRLNNELANAKRTLSLQNKSLERLHAEKDKMLGVVAHDLCNPLSVITMCSQLILNRKASMLDDESHRLLENIMSGSEFMLEMVEDLINAAKISLGKLELRLEYIDLNTQVTNSVIMNRISAAQNEISIELDLPEDLGVAHVDSRKLRQVFNNLIDNAVKFSKPRTAVRVSAKKVGERFLVQVTDEGPGIPVVEQKKLFKAFATLNSRGADLRIGAGLGLSICKNIVEAHGGNIGFKTTEGIGSTFFFDMPYEQKHT